MDIDWDNAPEGATHYSVNNDDDITMYYKLNNSDEFILVPDINSKNLTSMVWVANNIKLIPEAKPVNVIDFGAIPDDKTVYTQAMSDNGELPSVGMEFMGQGYAYKEYDLSWFKLVALGVYNEKVIAESCSEVNQVELYSEFKPLPTPIELEDGQAYQFDYPKANRTKLICTYVKHENTFNNYHLKIDVDECTNIIKLVPEESNNG